MRTETLEGAICSMRPKISRMARELADQSAEDAGLAQAAARDFEFDGGLALAGGVGQDGAQAGGVHWLLQEVVGAELHGVDGELDGAQGGEHNNGQIGVEAGALLGELGQEANAVEAGHLEVGDDDGRVPGEGFFPGFNAVARGFGAVTPAGDQLGKPHEGVGLIFNDENLDRVFHRIILAASCT